ncbi:MAG: LysR substrate-binding domain-containing protein [Ectothiorhodospiraceae bacterium]|jgi:DNA-binding transcriptional LysR family regulator
MSFSFRQLQYFVAVSELGSISAAARELAVSQSTVTESLKDLEVDLGVSLLERHARGMSLTHKGHTFLRHAQRILAEISYARGVFAEETQVSGNLNIGVTSLVAGYALPDLLARYRRAYPATAVSVTEDIPEYLEHFLLNGELDVAVLILSALNETSAFNTTVIATYDFRVWLPMGHRLATASTVERSSLLEERYVLLESDEVRLATGALWQGLGGSPQVALRTSSVEAVRSLVGTGAGVSVLPDLVYRPWSLEGDRVDAVELADPLQAVEVGLAWRRGASVSEAARAFIDLALEHPAARHR